MTLIPHSQGPVLLTGASGFVGSHLARALVAQGKEVHALVRKSSNLWRLKEILPTLQLYCGDLAERESIERVVTRVKPRGVFHLGVSNVISGQGEGNEALIKTNLSGTVALLDAAAASGFDFFIAVGSFLEYGPKDHAVKESELCEPVELYGVAKLAGTLYGCALARAKKLPILALRLFTPYGPLNEPKRLTHMLIASALAGMPISLTSPSVSRDFIFVDDVVALLLEASERAKEFSGEIFNAGTGVRTTLGEVVSLVLKETGSKSKVEWGGFRDVAYDSEHWQADMAKTFSHFSWRPKHSLHDGLLKTIEHFKKYGV